MGAEAVFLCIIAVLLFAIALGIVSMIVYSKKQGVESLDILEENNTAEKKQLEFMKKIMTVLLAMWVLGGLVGLWVVCRDPTIEALELVQKYIQFPATVGITVYGCKSGAENCSKISATKESTVSYKSKHVLEEDHDE